MPRSLITGIVLFAIFTALAAGVSQRDYEFLLEADFQKGEIERFNCGPSIW